MNDKMLSKENKTDNKLDDLIKLAKIVARPWCICTWIFAVLLIASLVLNAWLACKEFNITFDADYNVESDIEQTNNG